MSNSERQPLLEPGQHDPLISPDIPVFPDSLPGTTYGKNISWTSAYILVVSRVIGSGIFATPGSIVKSAGSVGLTLLVWLVGTILSACGLSVSMEYGCMLPRSGGDKVYLEYAYRRPRFLASTVVAIHAVVLGFTASNCIVFAKYTLFALSIEPTDLQYKALAIGLLTTITIIHGFFFKTGIIIQNALGWVKIFLIGAMSLTGVWVLLLQFFGGDINTSPGARRLSGVSWDTLWEGSNWSWNLLSTALFKVIYSYAGLSNINNVLNEVQDPVRTLKTVCPSALFTAGGLYLLANLSYLLVVPLDEIKNSGELVGALLFERLFGNIGSTLFPLAIAISAAGNVMVVTFALVSHNRIMIRTWLNTNTGASQPRNCATRFLTVAKAAILFASLWYSARGLIVHYVPSLLVIALPPQQDVYNFILDVEGYPGNIMALAVTIGLLILRYKEPSLPRPFKAWLPAVWLRVVVCITLLVAPFIPPPGRQGDVHFFYATYAIVGISIIIFAVLYWYVWTVILPRRGGYRLKEAVETLDDGTTITKLVRSFPALSRG
ncbi:low-affinity methionine permease [Penicillium frequentans]|nr:low-affinity methionine permease [Penicillium glabrum]